jgi:hypothetical protein
VLAVQAQAQLIQSNHDCQAAWRKLAIALNCPDMPPAPLAGRVDGPVPLISYEAAREKILRTHTDLLTAQNAAAASQFAATRRFAGDRREQGSAGRDARRGRGAGASTAAVMGQLLSSHLQNADQWR